VEHDPNLNQKRVIKIAKTLTRTVQDGPSEVNAGKIQLGCCPTARRAASSAKEQEQAAAGK